MRLRYHSGVVALVWGFGWSLVWAAPDQSMSIAPAATSGTTITAADENTRNNSISTPYNAHSHTDISTTSANTLSVGNGEAGNKHLCANAADATDACLRWDDTANLWTLDNPTQGAFNQIATISSTTGVTGVLRGDGTGALTQFAPTPDGDDTVLVSDSATTGTFRTVPNCTDTGGNHLNYTQSSNSFSCGTSGASLDISARVTNTSQSISNNSATVVTYGSETFDTDTIHDTGSNTSRLTATTAGKYLILSSGSIGCNTTGDRQIRLRVNGTTTIANVTGKSTVCANEAHYMQVSAYYNFSATNYVETLVYQDSGGSLTFAADGADGSFSMVKVP